MCLQVPAMCLGAIAMCSVHEWILWAWIALILLPNLDLLRRPQQRSFRQSIMYCFQVILSLAIGIFHYSPTVSLLSTKNPVYPTPEDLDSRLLLEYSSNDL
jgi:hypothetical protein